ncbi:aminopeptidase Ey-like [Cloeon dipterum]|uniref:aminopeptidase Ey-like n=1 Tax=Cloeon dipterum TaxID=197152 RepID=UPI00321FC04A
MWLTRIFAVAVLAFALANGTPLWLRPELPLDAKLSSNPRALADYQLPTSIIPSHYEIELIPFLNDNVPEGQTEFTFIGKVIITVTCNEDDISSIKMHAKDMTISGDVTVEADDGTGEVTVLGYVEEPTDDKDFLIINLAAPLEQKDYKITINYLGNLNGDLDGFYRSSYVEDGVTKWMAVTQFESTGARRAFPSFDEPGMKATFKLKIAKSADYKVLANMPLDTDDEPVSGFDGMTWADFANTEQRMSTYLVAFSVNKFSNIGKQTFDAIDYDLWARPNAVQFGDYANQHAPKVVAEMTSFTNNIRYAMPKIDQIAVPDFSAGAMENWGLITYRETALLYDEATASTSNKQRVGAVVTHELAHQWFGNYVSPKWWSNLWLNEGFATYFEYFATNKIETDWKMDEQFIYEQLQSALIFDAQESTHPIVADVDEPSTIDSIFDDISYNKGGCIVRLLVNLLGESAFKTGINTYLTNNQFNNADADDLWTALQTVVPDGFLPDQMTLKNVMDTWTLQGGFPVITFTRLYDENQRATIEQERFLALPSETAQPGEWVVPISWTNAAENNFDDVSADDWLTAPNKVVYNVGKDEDWVILNLQLIGFYRVNYDVRNWEMLTQALSADGFSQIHVINRAQIIDDSLALARANHLAYSTALDTTNYLDSETEYLPWASAFDALAYINDRLNSEAEPKNQFETYLKNRLKNTYNSLGGFNIPEAGDAHVTSLTRAMVLNWACKLSQTECNNEASNLFKQWQTTEDPDLNNPINPNLKSVVYCSGVRNGDRTSADFLFDRYKAASQDATEQSRILSALGCSSDTGFLEEYLLMTITSGSDIRTQDTRTVITAVYSNPIGVDLALEFVTNPDNYQIISTNLGGFSSVGRIYSGLATKLNTVEQRDKLQNFVDTNGAVISEGVKNAIAGAIETVEQNIKWRDEHKDGVVNYLKSKNSAAAMIISPILLACAILTRFL